MDYLELADAAIRNLRDGDTDEHVLAQSALSIAAALIALAERKPQFVQVGGCDLTPAHIASIIRFDGGITVWTVQGMQATLRGPDADAFLSWWNGNADVVRLGEGE